MTKTSIPACLTALALAALTAGSANAASISVADAGFEDTGSVTIKTAGDAWADVAAWTGLTPIDDDSGITNEVKRTGSFAGKMNSSAGGGGFYQLTDHTITIGETFTLTFYASTTWDGQDTRFGYSLIYGNTSQVLATDDFVWDRATQGNLTGIFQEVTLTGTATAAMDGTKVGIMFEPEAGGSFPVIDDVSLTVIPESSTALLGGIGALLFLRRRFRTSPRLKHRRKST
ncbi:hypothetical protein [Haloferula sp. A504]|uniref:hypothetical protein n=1 Tax=Haloferula sp. A504 TaxID=3373601 RepID=UPI0031CA8E92|nr:hypothetical protein [Verrucomicrobiaceae bacterium E54]